MLFWQALSYRFGKSEVKTKPPSGWKEALSLAYLMHGAECIIGREEPSALYDALGSVILVVWPVAYIICDFAACQADICQCPVIQTVQGAYATGNFDPLAKAAKDGWGVVVYSFLCFSHSWVPFHKNVWMLRSLSNRTIHSTRTALLLFFLLFERLLYMSYMLT